ncbi:hypothetical protein [Aquimarina hainanensis]
MIVSVIGFKVSPVATKQSITNHSPNRLCLLYRNQSHCYNFCLSKADH